MKRGYTAAKVLRLQFPLGRRNSAYCRYIIICQGRCGSNFLRGLLNSHPRILALGELFREPHGLPAYDLPLFFLPRADGLMFRGEPVRFLEQRVFAPYPSYLSAVGFKVVYYQLLRPEMSPILDHLRHQEELKIIHLKRRDSLKRYLSFLQAQSSRKWINTSGVKHRQRPVAIDIDEFLESCHTAQAQQDQYDELFRHHQQVEVFYEDLVGDLDGEMRHIQAFLGVEQRKLTPLTYKQSYLPLSAAISNYAEVKERLAPFLSTADRERNRPGQRRSYLRP